ncbi:hypothetical protein L195_g051394, partial [Trifolium pratense]
MRERERQKRGGASADSGEWTEVRRRRRKALRQDEEGFDRHRQNRGCKNFEYSKSGRDFSIERYHDPKFLANDHNRLGRSRSRYNRGTDAIHRSGKRNYARSSSNLHRSDSVSGKARRRLDLNGELAVAREEGSDGRKEEERIERAMEIGRDGRKKEEGRDRTGSVLGGAGRSKIGWMEEEGREVVVNGEVQENVSCDMSTRDGAAKENARTGFGSNKLNGGDVNLDVNQRKGDTVPVVPFENENGGGVSGSTLKR